MEVVTSAWKARELASRFDVSWLSSDPGRRLGSLGPTPLGAGSGSAVGATTVASAHVPAGSALGAPTTHERIDAAIEAASTAEWTAPAPTSNESRVPTASAVPPVVSGRRAEARGSRGSSLRRSTNGDACAVPSTALANSVPRRTSLDARLRGTFETFRHYESMSDERRTYLRSQRRGGASTAELMGSGASADPAPIVEGEVLLRVAFHHSVKPRVVQEFLVLGSQTLADLRDRLYCVEDHVLDGPSHTCCYFCIEGVLYEGHQRGSWPDDPAPLRPGSAALASPTTSGTTPALDVAVKWAREAPAYDRPWGALRVCPMEDAVLGDLPLRLGAHYLYCHQGECEHIIVVTDVRLADRACLLDASSYPQHVYQAATRRRKCSSCGEFKASFLCYGDHHLDTSPFAMCEVCYHALHYSQDGALLYDEFTVFPYYHD